MKNLTLGILALFALLAFQSCSTCEDVISHRRYNNRYYIEMSQREQSETPETANRQDKTRNNEILRHHPIQAAPDPSVTEKRPVLATDEPVISGTTTTITIPLPGNSEAGETNPNTMADRYSTVPTNEKKDRAINRFSTMKKTITTVEPSHALQTEEDALSLLWVIILVILILWAIGLLAGGFGIGGLINLLLLIALILLILWLLRVI